MLHLPRITPLAALSMKLKSKSISVIESLDFKNPKTKSFVDMLSAIGLEAKKTLLVIDGLNKNVYLSARNFNKSEVVSDSEISTYKIINAQHLIIEEKADQTKHFLIYLANRCFGQYLQNLLSSLHELIHYLKSLIYYE